MVTAGIYLFIRLGPLLELCETSLMIIIWLGALGSIMGAISGLLAIDLKRVVAYSTVSQLGYMAVACGASQYSVALFHLINHAFFKALLFLSAGAVIHALLDNQDMRRMGGLHLLLHWTYGFILLGNLSMMALPFLTGFYSKDFLLETLVTPQNLSRSAAMLLITVAALFTAAYSIRLMIITFIAIPNHYLPRPLVIINYWISLFILASGAAFFGYCAGLYEGDTYHITALGTVTSTSAEGVHLGHLGQPLILSVSWLIVFSALSVSTEWTSGFTGVVTVVTVRSVVGSWNHYNGQVVSVAHMAALLLARYFDLGLLQLVGPQGLIRLFHFATFHLELFGRGFVALITSLSFSLPTILYLFLLSITIYRFGPF